MIVGLLTLIGMLFGGGSVDQFYIDDIDKGVKKYVQDKDRKKELKGLFDEYKDVTADWNKVTKTEMKEFKRRNLDRGASLEWYANYFEGKLMVREEVMAKYIDLRLQMQEIINDGEWGQIMELSSSADAKQEKKEDKAASKSADKDMFKKLREATQENVQDEAARDILALAWDNFEKQYTDVAEVYQDLDVNHSDLMANKDATAEEFAALTVILLEIRAESASAFMEFIAILKENTTDEGYTAIMKQFNKLMK